MNQLEQYYYISCVSLCNSNDNGIVCYVKVYANCKEIIIILAKSCVVNKGEFE